MGILIRTALVPAAASMPITGGWARVDPAGFAAWAGRPNHRRAGRGAGA
ncbi:hypothetical protein ACU635_17695 [[Actinomadura] parvosata]